MFPLSSSTLSRQTREPRSEFVILVASAMRGALRSMFCFRVANLIYIAEGGRLETKCKSRFSETRDATKNLRACLVQLLPRQLFGQALPRRGLPRHFDVDLATPQKRVSTCRVQRNPNPELTRESAPSLLPTTSPSHPTVYTLDSIGHRTLSI